MNVQLTEAILIATFKIQSALHTLDDVEINNPFKQRKKQEFNNLLETLQKLITMQEIDIDLMLCEVDGEQAQNYVDIVKKFDDLGKQIKITV